MSYCYNCFHEHSAPGPCPHCGYDPAQDAGRYPQALPHGTILAGQFITGRVLGQGGFGITYLALDNKAGDRVALKEFLPDTMAGRSGSSLQVTAYSGERGAQFQYGLDCFLEEARTLAKFIGNPNIVGVRSYFQENGTAYFTMDYIDGVSLKAYLRQQGGKVSWQEAQRLLTPVLDALEAVHREGLVHRDVTPDNIYIAGNGEVKLLDFGAARYSLGDRSRSLDVVLKPGYAPKEQYTRRGRQGSYTDVYSLGACFYAAITGAIPPEALDRMEEDDLVPPSSRGVKLPPALEDAILKALEVQPQDRFQTMAEFRSALPESEAERLERERLERERLAKERLEKERLEKERLAKERLQQERLEKERLERERLEKERQEAARQEAAHQEAARQEEPPCQEEPPHQEEEPPKETPGGEKPDAPKPGKRWLPFAGIGAAAVVLAAVLCVMLLPKDRVDPQDDPDPLPVNDDIADITGSRQELPAPPTDTNSPASDEAGQDPGQGDTPTENDPGQGDAPAENDPGQGDAEGTGDPAAPPEEPDQTESTPPPDTTATTTTAPDPTSPPEDPRKITYNGSDYEGDTKNGVPHGTGTMTYKADSSDGGKTYAKGDKYTGAWVNGKRDGQGTIWLATGSTYTGQWKNDRYNGQGTEKNADGYTITGTFTNTVPNGMCNGQLTVTFDSGDVYSGTFVEGDLQGQGTYTAPDGTQYKGTFQDTLFHGQGTMTWTNGDRYTGGYQYGERSGQGTYTWSDGSYYTGAWKNNVRNGQGTEYAADGSVYFSGTWKDDSPADDRTTVTDEPYTMVTSQFSVSGSYTGGWKNGKPSGEGTLTVQQTDDRWDYGDTLWSASWVSGLIEGYGQWRSAVDGAYDGNFSKGLKSGKGKMWFSDGTVYDGQWSNGEFVG